MARSAIIHAVRQHRQTSEWGSHATLTMLRWLDNNRGAVGALSLDDALATISSFVALFDFASDVHMELRTNQKEVLHRALDRTDI